MPNKFICPTCKGENATIHCHSCNVLMDLLHHSDVAPSVAYAIAHEAIENIKAKGGDAQMWEREVFH